VVDTLHESGSMPVPFDRYTERTREALLSKSRFCQAIGVEYRRSMSMRTASSE